MVEQYRRALEAQLQRQEVRQAIEEIKSKHAIFKKYPALEDLFDLGRPGNRNYEDKDAVLAILLSELKQETTLFPLLNRMFWESLMRLYHRKRRSVPNPKDLFSRVQLDFYHTAVSYPLDRRPRKIDVNLILDTKKKVTRWQREEGRYHKQHEEFGPAHEGRPSLAELQVSKVFPEQMEEYLLDLTYRKVINERQLDLLREVDVYQRMTEKKWAEARGFAYATVRSWHFRAEAAIRRYEKARHAREQEVE